MVIGRDVARGVASTFRRCRGEGKLYLVHGRRLRLRGDGRSSSNIDGRAVVWMLALIFYCGLTNVDGVFEEDSTAPTIPIPDGFTAKADVPNAAKTGDTADSAPRRKSSITSPPCTPGSDYEYHVVSKGPEKNWVPCFELVNVTADWLVANETCTRRSGHLARPLSANDTNLIEAMLDRHPVSRDYWIDANDMNTEGQWRWSDGTAVEYVNWRPGRPINSSRHFSRDCAELHRNFKWLWNDKDCVDQKNFFLCQYRVRVGDGPLPEPPSEDIRHFSSSSSPPSSSSTRPRSTSSPSTSPASSSSIVITDSPNLYSTTQLRPDSFTTTTSKSASPSSSSSSRVYASPSYDRVPSTPESSPATSDDFVPPSGDGPFGPPVDPVPAASCSPGGVTPSQSLSPGQIALLVLCIVAVLLLAFFAGLVALPCLRRKMKINSLGSSPSSPSSSIESQTDSSLNSSGSLSSNTSSSQQPWAAVLKCFDSHPFNHHSNRHHHHHYNGGSLPSVSLTTAPPEGSRASLAATLAAAPARSPTVDFLRAEPAQLSGVPRRAVSFSTPDLLPDVEVSPQLPAFTIKRKPGAGNEDDSVDEVAAPVDNGSTTPRRRSPRWRLSNDDDDDDDDGSGVGVSNPVYMADVIPHDGRCVPGERDDNETDDLRGDSPPPCLDDSKLELDLGEGLSESCVETPQRRVVDNKPQSDRDRSLPTLRRQRSTPPESHQQRQLPPQSRRVLRLPMTTRNMFMKEVLGNRDAGNTFKYEKF